MKLERELGTVLLHRSKRHVQLTAAGEVFLEHVTGILTAVNEGANAARRAARGEIGRLDIAFFLGATYTLLPRILRRFRAENPTVKLGLQDMELPQVLDAVISGAVDVGFLRPPATDPAISTEVLLREPFVAAVPEGNKLGKKRQLRLADLADEPFVMFAPSRSVLYSQIMHGCHQAGFHPNVVQEARRPETLVGLVGAGAGIALVASSVQMRGGTGVIFKKITGPLPMTEIAVVSRRKNPSPLVDAFLQTARCAMR
ncbi:MAG: LysR family transcriptional regulator [Betaproteobacteria bacterium]|nr:LysR family transcriptional regulator [Betaproteobacteria bacterium]